MNDIDPSRRLRDIVPSTPLSTFESAPAANPLALVHTHLRGRYVATVLLALLLAIPGGLAGFYAIPPKYSSVGLVKVDSVLPKVLYQTDENQQMPNFDAFVSTQATILTSRRVLERAVDDPELRAAGWPPAPSGIERLQLALKADIPRRSNMIALTAADDSPRAAQRAVNAVLKSYDYVQEEMNGKTASDKEKALVELQQKLQRDLDTTRDAILTRAQEFGTDDLDAIHKAKVAELIGLDADIGSLQSKISTSGGTTGVPVVPTTEQLARSDAELARLLQDRDQAAATHRALAATVGPEHRDLKALAEREQQIADAIGERVRVLIERGSTAAESMGGSALTPEQLDQALIQLRALREQKAQEMLGIGRARLAIGSLREHAEDTKRSLDEAVRELDKYGVERENTAGGRVSIAQWGDLPSRPSTDRRLPVAFFGAGCGAGLAVGSVLLFGFLRGGFRFIDQLEAALAVPFLGAIPELASAGSAEQELAGRSIHQLRNTLGSMPSMGASGRGRVYVITSPHSGDGKTSLTLALGQSFASARYRTVVVDADLVGRGLSIELGLAGASGLAEVLTSGTLNGELRNTGQGKVSAVPAGAVARCAPESISAGDLRGVLDQLRERFDIVLVDTGPVLGSLEANLVAPMADQVVLVVSRGNGRGAVEAALARLRNLGAATAGLVFNRAMVRDFVESSSPTATRSASGAGRKGSVEASALVRVVQGVERSEG